ncbi:MAG: hypothetical protein WKF43_13455 [Acidimicrobiales bacterium]
MRSASITMVLAGWVMIGWSASGTETWTRWIGTVGAAPARARTEAPSSPARR